MRVLAQLLVMFLFLNACNDEKTTTTTSENDVDAARNFIRAALDGDYESAKKYMLQDSLNNQLLNTFDDNYRKHMSREDKRAYRESSIRIPEIKKINDTASVIIYSNSYKNQNDSLKVIKQNDQWLVDFKYSFPMKNEEND